MWMLTLLFARVVLSATTSVFQKRLTLDGVRSAHIWMATYALAAPLALCALLAGDVWRSGAGFWLNAIVAGVLDAFGNLAMVAALRTTDLSIFAPLNGLRPVLALFFGLAFLGEQVSFAGAAGIFITVIGSILLLGDDRKSQNSKAGAAWRTLGWRLLGLSLSTLASVFLKRALESGSTEGTLGVWVLCGMPVAWIGLMRFGGGGEGKVSPWGAGRLLTFHAVLFFIMQALTLEVFRRTPLAYSFAFFQLGMVLQVLLAAGFLVSRRC